MKQKKLRTIARMVFTYQGNDYPFEYDFGYGYPESGAEYMFMDGNYSCDCNRSRFLGEVYDGFPLLDCGEEIGMKDFEVVTCE